MRAVIFTDELRTLATDQPAPAAPKPPTCSWCENPATGEVCHFSGTGEEDIPSCDDCAHYGDDFMRYRP